MSKKQNVEDERRSIRWVDPAFQMRYAFLLLSVVLLVSTILIGTFWFQSDHILATLKAGGLNPESPLYLLLARQLHNLLLSVSAIVAVFCVFLIVMGYFLSHRIVGPIYAIKRSMESIGRGDFASARVNLRSDDEFQDVAVLINRSIDQLEAAPVKTDINTTSNFKWK